MRSPFCHRAAVLFLALATLLVTACSRESPPAAAPSRALEVTQSVGDGRRIALVVGNSSYAASPLTNPANDANLIAATLRDVGFEVQLQTDSDQKAMKRAIQAFGASLEQAGASAVGLFYYAGHGVQMNGRNYLIPVNAAIARDADVEIEAVSADWVLEQMRYARNRLNFVILDACRNNPFARSFRSGDGGLAKMDAPAGVLIAYSTAPGEVAADGTGRNSPYTEALAHSMRESAEPAELMFKQARDSVRRVTHEQQTPWESSSLTGQNFYFGRTRRSTAAQVNAPAVVEATPMPAAPPRVEEEGGFASGPMFMSEPLCARAVGEWKVETDAGKGRIRLDKNAKGVARLTEESAVTPLSWSCDGGNRKYIIKYQDGATHTVIIDGEEKLMFGYGRDDKSVMYTR